MMMLIPALENTSLQDIGIAYEWWIFFAVLISSACEKNWEAAFKCFLFCLISRPIVLVVETLGGVLTMQDAIWEYQTSWMLLTFLALPAGFIAHYAKRDTLFGSLIMGLINATELIMAGVYLVMALVDFPYHLASGLFSLAFIVFLTLKLQKTKRGRLIAFLFPVGFLALLVLGISLL